MLRAWWLVRRPTTRGAKLLLHDGGGRVLMVRHTYGKRDEWELPGGSLGRREAPQDGAAREAHEELGVRLAWRPVVALPVGGAGKLTMLHPFQADLDGAD